MSVYLKDIPLPDAKALMQSALEKADLWHVLGIENIPLDEYAIGRVLAKPIWARISSPHYHASAMDGFAVHSTDTIGAQPSNPITLSMGTDALYLDTGDPLPDGFDAVIPIENVESINGKGEISSSIRHPDSIRIRAAVTPWSQVRLLGEDIIQSQLVLAAGQALRPVDLGVVAAAGHQMVGVARYPQIAIIPTGTELVPLGTDLKSGNILEYNSIVLAAQIKTWGGAATRFPITPDVIDTICDRVKEAAQHYDLILLNAGSSAGSEDYSAQVVEKLGTLLVHGVAVRPGHPVILGMIKREEHKTTRSGKNNRPKEVPIIGVPGYPVSAILTAEIFVEPLIAQWTGRRPQELPVELAYLTRKTTSPGGDDDYMRVSVGKVGDRLLATPLSRAAGVISSLVRADGLVLMPRGIQGKEAGEVVEVRLYRSVADLARTIFCVGSHDMTLDLLAQFMTAQDRRLVSTNVGSLAGLIALQHGEAHMAGSHLLDPDTGEYNSKYIHEYLTDIPVIICGFVERVQGLMVEKGNKKGVKNLQDLRRPDIRFANRQRGAGTRVLLDYHLAKSRISPELIRGYTQEEYTHLGVAVAIASGRADCGLGIPAAAQSLNLDFIPLFQEKYQLIIPRVFADSLLLTPLFKVLDDSSFRKAVTNMAGYDVKHMGKLIAEA
jgi:putative molybdopterin biosynthesis protein